MGLQDMLNASKIQAENERLKEENKKLAKKLEDLGFDDYMEIKKSEDFLKREIQSNKRVLANLDNHMEELTARTEEVAEQINEQIKQLMRIREMNKKMKEATNSSLDLAKEVLTKEELEELEKLINQ